ncbi:MAG: hypothetical protein ABIP75_05755 [Pyrinomonadaceae bacterium]
MTQLDRLRDICALYFKHSWRLRRVLARPELKAELLVAASVIPAEAEITDAEVDALWFSRPAQGDREAWELRLISDLAYALFETFEADETDEERQDVKLEMEARMRDYAGGGAA